MTDLPRPVCIVEAELGGPPPVVPERAGDGRPYERALVALRVHGTFVGAVELPAAPASDLADRAASELRDEVDRHLAADRHEDCRAARSRTLAQAPKASVIVASRDGERTLGECLDSLLALDHPDFEVIVVDNASRGDGVRSIASGRGERVRYVREDRPGLAVAHNAGLRHAGGDIVAFTDDDVIADRLWLAQLARAFALSAEVACVTGMILPAELESPAQLWVDGWGFGKGFERRVFDGRRRADRPLHPYTAGSFGSGANMAFRTRALRDLGGFDPALGTGSPALGGDDLAAFFEVLEAGHQLVYEPSAVVFHHHRPDYDSLRRQAYCYGVGLTAYLAKALADEPRRVLEVARRVPAAVAHILGPASPKNARRPEGFPAELIRLERRGMLVGAFAYARSRRASRAMTAAGAR